MRDVQFSIRDYFTFAATFENGNVQLWDIRRPDRYERMFTAHNGPVFCCDWHPEDRWVLGLHRGQTAQKIGFPRESRVSDTLASVLLLEDGGSWYFFSKMEREVWVLVVFLTCQGFLSTVNVWVCPVWCQGHGGVCK